MRRPIEFAQYTSIKYTDRLDELGAAPSVGSKGDAYDNAMAEAWVATFKSELVDGRRFPSFEDAEHEVLHRIDFYNGGRLYEALGDVRPAEYEELNYRRDNTPVLSATSQRLQPPRWISRVCGGRGAVGRRRRSSRGGSALRRGRGRGGRASLTASIGMRRS